MIRSALLVVVAGVPGCGSAEPACPSLADAGGVEYVLGPNGSSPAAVVAELQTRVARAGLCAEVREDRGLVEVGVVGEPPENIERLWTQDPGVRIAAVVEGEALRAALGGRLVPQSVHDVDFGASRASRAALISAVGDLPDALALGLERSDDPAPGWQPVFLDRSGMVTSSQVREVALDPNTHGHGWTMTLKLDEAGTRSLTALTEAHLGQQIAVIFEGRVVARLVVTEPIRGGVAQLPVPALTARQVPLTAALARAEPLPNKVILEASRVVGRAPPR